MPEDKCHCGKPLHYKDPKEKAYVDALIATYGRDMRVTRDGRTWIVPRSYIALHPLKGVDVSSLGFEEVKKKRD